MAITVRNVEAKEKFYGECVAQDSELRIISDGNIYIWAYSFPDFLLCWWVFAETPGSGSFRDVLNELRKGVTKPIKMVQPTLQRIYDLYYDMGFEMVSVTPEIAVRLPEKPKLSEIGPLRNNSYLPDDFFRMSCEFMHQLMHGANVPGTDKHEMRFSKDTEQYLKGLHRKYPNIFQSGRMVNSNRLFPEFPL